MSSEAQAAATRFLSEAVCGQSRCRCAISARRGQGLTHCPVHNDKTPSFNVTVKGDRLLVCCEAGCAQEDVVTALKEAGVWPQKATYGKQVVAEYDYRAADGTLLYQALRYFPKDFRQRRPDGKGGWVWNLDGVERVLYRLPELLASGTRGVFLVEGEKDVDRLMAGGLVATCNVGGAGKWRDEYSAYLRNRLCIVVVDNDEAGRQHGRQVADSLKGVSANVRWLELEGLDDKGDVSDWLDDGHTIEELKRLAADAAPPPAPAKRERVFRQEGLGYRFEPIEAAIIGRISRLDRDGAKGELHITRADGRFILRRQVNLLASTGATLKSLEDDLKEEELGADVDWKRLLRHEFEAVLDAHRNGLVMETVGGDIAPPPPIEWLYGDLVLKNKVNCWLAAAGTGKSTLAKALCVCHSAGLPFLGRDGPMGRALYLDWEDDKDDLERVAYEVCRGMNLWPVPQIHWIRMRGKRIADHLEMLARKIGEHNIDLVVVDAVAAASSVMGEHVSYEAVALELEQALGQLPPVTVLALDHVTADEHRNGKTTVPVKGRGAERKVEFIRNQWTLMLDRSQLESGRHVVAWYHTKINQAALRPQFSTEIVHEPGRLRITEHSIDASPEAVERLPVHKQNVIEVRRHPGQTAREICMAVRGEEGKSRIDTTRMELNREARRGEVYENDGRWYPAGHPGANTDLPFDAPDAQRLPYREP